uniref:Uncharacterized protein n=1 Tax=Sphaerodactylus townsendi TaxID=933632 RepID=A0ACB8GEM2_9SAUR
MATILDAGFSKGKKWHLAAHRGFTLHPPQTTQTEQNQKASDQKTRKQRSSGSWLFQISDLFDQVVLLVCELFVVCPFRLEVAQKLDEFGLVFQQDVNDGGGLVWTGHKDL